MQQLSVTTEKGSHSSVCAEQLLDALPLVMRFVRKHMRSTRSRGLSVPQFRALGMLHAFPASSLSSVADFLGASLPTTSRMVSCLVSKGFIQRRECPEDRRCIALVLTGRGIAEMKKSRRATQSQLAGALGSLSGEDRQVVLEAMKLMHGLFGPNGH